MSDKKENQPSVVKKEPKNHGSVFIYLAVLFAAAFFLLLMAYLMQQRSNQETIGSMQESLTLSQSLNDMIDQNRELQEKIDSLNDDLKASQEETITAQAATNEAEKLAQSYQTQLTFVANLLILEDMLAEEEYQTAAQLCVKMYSHVPTAPIEADSSYDAAAHYQSIVDSLVTGGYLAVAEDGTPSSTQAEQP